MVLEGVTPKLMEQWAEGAPLGVGARSPLAVVARCCHVLHLASMQLTRPRLATLGSRQEPASSSPSVPE